MHSRVAKREKNELSVSDICVGKLYFTGVMKSEDVQWVSVQPVVKNPQLLTFE
jgi:hypothetical protein